MKLFLALCLVIVAIPQSSRSADWAYGIASAGYFSNDNIAEGFFFGDFALKVEREAWGAEIGMFGVVGRLHETYATATYTTGTDKLSFGFPRPSYDDFANSALTAITPKLSLESIGSIRSRTTYGTMYLPEFLPYGARYSSQIGNLDYATSLHAVPGYPDVVAGGAIRLIQGQWMVDLAAEAIVQGVRTHWNTKAQVVGDFGPITLGVGIFYPKANNQATLVEVFGRFDASDNAQITGLVRADTEDSPMFGLGLSQQLSSPWTLRAGLLGSDTNDLAASANLQVQF